MKKKDIILYIQELYEILNIQKNSLELLQEEILETEVKLNKFRKKLIKKNDTKIIK